MLSAKVWNAQAITGAATYNSPSTSMKNHSFAWYQVAWTGTPAGNLIAQFTLDNDTISDANANWDPLPTSGNANPSGAAGRTVFYLGSGSQPLVCNRVRLQQTNTSGTGTITATVLVGGF